MTLTDEDRNWLSSLITTLIAQSEERTAASIRESEQRTGQAVTAAIEAIEATEATETRLLTEFHKWASPR
jgi:hypothetical protein